MSTGPTVGVRQLARRFWAEAGDPPSFPRDLREPLSWVQHLHVVEVPGLTTARAAEAFARHNVPFPTTANRALSGCFAGCAGTGFILYDPTLDRAEVAFTLAHESAHFLRDYDAPRRKIAARLGPRALEVLDGKRPATVEERLAGVLRGVAVGCHTHFLDRDRWGRVRTDAAHESEEAADRLAFELLAPFDAVKPGAGEGRAALASRLVSAFGLPEQEANKYATILVR